MLIYLYCQSVRLWIRRKTFAVEGTTMKVFPLESFAAYDIISEQKRYRLTYMFLNKTNTYTAYTNTTLTFFNITKLADPPQFTLRYSQSTRLLLPTEQARQRVKSASQKIINFAVNSRMINECKAFVQWLQKKKLSNNVEITLTSTNLFNEQLSFNNPLDIFSCVCIIRVDRKLQIQVHRWTN